MIEERKMTDLETGRETPGEIRSPHDSSGMIRTTMYRVPGMVLRKGEARKMAEGFLSSMSNRGKDG